MSERSLSRRLFLTRTGKMVLTLGATPLIGLRQALAGPVELSARRRLSTAADPYARGLWLSGDHHIHTQYSIDGLYEIEEQVQAAVTSGLDFCVITDHGGAGHDRVLLSRAYPELCVARRRHPEIQVFQGLEWNIPDAEHGSIIVPPLSDEAEIVAEFEARFDSRGHHTPPATVASEADAVAGVRYLQERVPKALFIANHPARRGLDSPHELRDWADAGPDVMRGFEGAPGHGAATLVGIPRGYYFDGPGARSFANYPPHAYRTWSGYDYYVAQVGGLWDSLLSEGRPFYITANSDSHRFHGDHREVDRSTYKTQGFVTRTGRLFQPDRHNPDEDYMPGAYARTYVHAASREPMAILEGMRSGNMWTVQGDILAGFELLVCDSRHAAPMGSTLVIERGAEVEVVVRIKPAVRKNLGGQIPVLHHLDIIAGDIVGPLPASERDAQYSPTARVVAQLSPSVAERRGGWLELRHRFARVENSFYVRVRGTSSDLVGPRLDPPDIDPFADLWFYSNPVMVKLAVLR